MVVNHLPCNFNSKNYSKVHQSHVIYFLISHNCPPQCLYLLSVCEDLLHGFSQESVLLDGTRALILQIASISDSNSICAQLDFKQSSQLPSCFYRGFPPCHSLLLPTESSLKENGFYTFICIPHKPGSGFWASVN